MRTIVSCRSSPSIRATIRDVERTPLHSIVSVICDALLELPIADQARALEAARVALGLRAYSAPIAAPYQPLEEMAVSVPTAPRPETVRIQMMGGAPLVMNPAVDRSARGRALVVLGPQPRRFAGHLSRETSRPAVRGYVHSLR